MMENDFFREQALYRVVKNFLVQFGIPYSSLQRQLWDRKGNIEDDPKREDLMPFKRGYISFAGNGENSRYDSQQQSAVC